MARSLVSTGLLVLGLVLPACGGKKDAGEASCEAVGAHFEKLSRERAEALPEDHPDKAATRAAEALLPKLRDNLVKDCRKDGWPEEVRRCVLDAPDAAAVEARCKKLLDQVHGQGEGGQAS